MTHPRAYAGELRATFDVYSDGLLALPLNIIGTKFWRALRARQAILDVMERARPTRLSSCHCLG